MHWSFFIIVFFKPETLQIWKEKHAGKNWWTDLCRCPGCWTLSPAVGPSRDEKQITPNDELIYLSTWHKADVLMNAKKKKKKGAQAWTDQQLHTLCLASNALASLMLSHAGDKTKIQLKISKECTEAQGNKVISELQECLSALHFPKLPAPWESSPHRAAERTETKALRVCVRAHMCMFVRIFYRCSLQDLTLPAPDAPEDVAPELSSPRAASGGICLCDGSQIVFLCLDSVRLCFVPAPVSSQRAMVMAARDVTHVRIYLFFFF